MVVQSTNLSNYDWYSSIHKQYFFHSVHLNFSWCVFLLRFRTLFRLSDTLNGWQWKKVISYHSTSYSFNFTFIPRNVGLFGCVIFHIFCFHICQIYICQRNVSSVMIKNNFSFKFNVHEKKSAPSYISHYVMISLHCISSFATKSTKLMNDYSCETDVMWEILV